MSEVPTIAQYFGVSPDKPLEPGDRVIIDGVEAVLVALTPLRRTDDSLTFSITTRPLTDAD